MWLISTILVTIWSNNVYWSLKSPLKVPWPPCIEKSMYFSSAGTQGLTFVLLKLALCYFWLVRQTVIIFVEALKLALQLSRPDLYMLLIANRFRKIKKKNCSHLIKMLVIWVETQSCVLSFCTVNTRSVCVCQVGRKETSFWNVSVHFQRGSFPHRPQELKFSQKGTAPATSGNPVLTWLGFNATFIHF